MLRAGIFAGVSSGGAISAALRLSATVSNAVIVAIVCDRGDRLVLYVFVYITKVVYITKDSFHTNLNFAVGQPPAFTLKMLPLDT